MAGVTDKLDVVCPPGCQIYVPPPGFAITIKFADWLEHIVGELTLITGFGKTVIAAGFELAL